MLLSFPIIRRPSFPSCSCSCCCSLALHIISAERNLVAPPPSFPIHPSPTYLPTYLPPLLQRRRKSHTTQSSPPQQFSCAVLPNRIHYTISIYRIIHCPSSPRTEKEKKPTRSSFLTSIIIGPIQSAREE